MAVVRLLPHRIASPDSVSWHHWWTESDGDRIELSAAMKGWDYASHTTVGISVELDERALLASTGLDSVGELEILAVADCPMAQQRYIAAVPLLGYQPGSRLYVSVQLPPGEVAGAVNLSAHLVLARTVPERQNRIAFLRGSRINSSATFTLRLEGDSGRFPTEPVHFTELGSNRPNGTVLTAYEDFSDAFLGHRLPGPLDHPAGRAA